MARHAEIMDLFKERLESSDYDDSDNLTAVTATQTYTLPVSSVATFHSSTLPVFPLCQHSIQPAAACHLPLAPYTTHHLSVRWHSVIG